MRDVSENMRIAWTILQLFTITVGACWLWGAPAAFLAFGVTHLVQERWQ